MCDYSLHHVASRPAKVGDKLVTSAFDGSATHGFCGVDHADVAVCLRPGTELAFENGVESNHATLGGLGVEYAELDGKVARFTQINMDQPHAFHDALEFPDGRKQVILSVPRYDFNWQLGYNVSIKVPKGAKLHVDAHFDNSAGNRANPNPNKTVYYGSMTWEEMMNPFYSVVVPVDVDPRNVVRSKYQQVGGGG